MATKIMLFDLKFYLQKMAYSSQHQHKHVNLLDDGSKQFHLFRAGEMSK